MNRILSKRIAAAVILLSLSGFLLQPASAAKSTLPFNDIATSYAKDAIIRLYEKQIITGTSTTTYSPKLPVTRAEFITILDRLLGLEPVKSTVSPFTDVAANAWYYGYVQTAVQLGLADGTSSSTFEPGKQVTRQEAAILLIRALKQSSASTGTGSTSVFKDAAAIADWAAGSVAAVQKLGLMTGDDTGKFRPQASLTREETAAILDRVLQNDKWSDSLEAEASDSEPVQLGWQYGQTTAQYEQTILGSNINTLSPRWYFISASGTLTDNTDKTLLTWADKQTKKVWAMVGNRSDQEATHTMLSSATARGKTVDALTKAVKQYGLDGLNIDFENVAAADRTSMTTFITELSTKLHAIDAVVAVNVSPDLGTDWTDAFDYSALGKQADYIVMMGYDEHWGGSAAGSVSSLTFVQNAVTKLLKVVSSSKVILAIPFYNRDWIMNSDGSTQSSTIINLSQQNALIQTYKIRPVWNSTVGQYTVSYKNSGLQHRIWVEDGRSVSLKYKLAVDKDLAGLAYWYIGGESTDIWDSLSNAERFYGMKLD